MSKRNRTLIAFLLTIVMFIGCLPAQIIALDEESFYNTEEADNAETYTTEEHHDLDG